MTVSTSPTVLAIAANDVGQYAKYHSNGKKYILQVGAKSKVMELMSHQDKDVRYQSLLAVQKLMTNAWEF